ncbi:hypothetical protein [Actinomadura fibrosa]|uniref:YqaJ viral recombinase domain-containing protein n=1 Tax=Actinomadura fibrosa TaxID=111802 RepID=A0ABW2Y0Q3_9ACTN|nr:hypothetical protein [Actinomadura fibrosa]
MAGEDAHIKGREGLERAKRWLDKSTRVAYAWTNEDEGLKELLEFDWPHGKDFSFDLGGKFRGGDLEGDMFLAEVKNYDYEMTLPKHYKDFLAKCYVALTLKPKRCSHFLWISWSPFQAQRWHLHTTAETVKDAVLAERERIFGTTDEAEAFAALDIATVAGVSERIWLITLCKQQERLVISPDHYSEIEKLMKLKEGA